MSEYRYDPMEEAERLGLKVKFISFKKLNSFLIEKIIYLRENLNRIEKRCALTYEIVHYLWKKNDCTKDQFWHSGKVDEILKQQTARKLVCPDKFMSLIATENDIDEISRELEVTNEILFYYIKYCKNKTAFETSKSLISSGNL